LYTSESCVFVQRLTEQFLKHQPDSILFRDKENKNYATLASEFIKACNTFSGVKSFLHQEADMAKELGATGVHLTSQQFDKISYAKSLGLEVVISTHTFDEVRLAEEMGANAVTYSPIFFSPGKGTPKGIEDLKKVVESFSINIYALGGIIEEEQVQYIEKANAYGFASIRYFT